MKSGSHYKYRIMTSRSTTMIGWIKFREYGDLLKGKYYMEVKRGVYEKKILQF